MSLNLIQHNTPGFYILVEGADRTGKSTFVSALCSALNRTNPDLPNAIATAEPTDSAYGKVIRERLKTATKDNRYELAYAFAADRQYHQSEVVFPALQRGEIVIQDRGSLSTMVYQHNLFPLGETGMLCREVFKPDMLLLFECSEEDFKLRERKDKDMYEQIPFTEVIDRFRRAAYDLFQHRFIVVNTSVIRDVDKIVSAMAPIIAGRIAERKFLSLDS